MSPFKPCSTRRRLPAVEFKFSLVKERPKYLHAAELRDFLLLATNSVGNHTCNRLLLCSTSRPEDG